MATQQEVIRNFMKSLDISTDSGVTALNNAVKACSSFTSLQNVIDNLISDCKSAKSVDAFLKEKCGIILDNDDTGAITGADAGGSKTKTAESIIPESSKASYPSGTSFTKRGLTVVVPKKDTLTKDQQTVVQGLYSWWIDSALKLIEDSYGYKFTDSDVSVKKITLKFIDSASSPAAYVTNNSTSTNGSTFKTTELTLNVNMNKFKNLSSSNVDGKSSETSTYLDRVLAHELTHAIMAAKIDDAQELPNFIMEGMAELTHGIDDERASDIKKLVGNTTQLKERLNVKNKSATAVNDLDYSAGYIFLRYLAKQAASSFSSTSTGGVETSSGDTYTLSNANSTITKGGTYKIQKGFTGTITINTTNAVTIDGTNAGNLKEVQIVTSSSTANLTIKNLNIANDDDSVIRFGKGTSNKLILTGKNKLQSGESGFGGKSFYNDHVAAVNVGGGLLIGGTGSLYIKSASVGIGTDEDEKSSADITINNGTINVVSTSQRNGLVDISANAGIGSGQCGSIGNITINGGNITVSSGRGAGIGSGQDASAGKIIINGGIINASADIGAGIGSGRKISGKSSVGDISISGGAIINASSNEQGIGSGYNASKGKITLNESSVTIKNGEYSTQLTLNGKTYTGRKLTFSNGRLTQALTAPEKSIFSWNDNKLITGSNSDDSIWNQANRVTLNALGGEDSIIGVNDNYVSINTGNDNDKITLYDGTYITAHGGNGNDEITLIRTKNNVVFGDDGDDALTGAWTDSLNTGNTLDGGKGNDFIECHGENFVIYGGDGDDNIFCSNQEDHFRRITVDGGTGNDNICIGSNLNGVWDHYSSIIGGAGDDTISVVGNYVTVSGGKGDDSIEFFGKTYIEYKAGDGNDTVYNDYFYKETIQALKISDGSYTCSTIGNDVIVKVGDGSILLKDAKGKKLNIQTVKGGSSTDTTPATTNTLTVTNTTKSPVTLDSSYKNANASSRTSAIQITGNSQANSILGGKGADTLRGGAGNDTLTGGAGNDSLVGNAGNDKLYGEVGDDKLLGGKGNDSLWGGKGNDSLWGGDGKDIFFYANGDGKDVIVDFNAGQDKIKIIKGSISKSSLSGSDVIFTVGKGSLTVKNAKGKPINLIDSKGKTSSTVVGSQTLTNSSSANVTIASDMGVVNASKRTKAIKITGNALTNTISGGSKNDSIYGGSGNDSLVGNAGNDKLYGEAGNDKLLGGSGNDSLWSGKGNDSLWGNAGKDTFFYSNGDGKDVIFGFDDNDTLTLDGLEFSTSYTKKTGDITFKIGSTSNAITLKDSTATTFHINNDTYKINGSKLVEK